MSLKTKIGLSFTLSASIIAILCVFELVIFMEIEKEIRYLEVADTIRSESLQIRRHEKNFFLYPLKAKEEAETIKTHLGRLNATLNESAHLEKSGEIARLNGLVNNYGSSMERIKRLLEDAQKGFGNLKEAKAGYASFFPLIQTGFYDQPLKTAELLEKVFSLPQSHPLITDLRNLDAEISVLRKIGEDIILASGDLDKVARTAVDDLIRISRAAIIIFLLLFLISGITTLYLINRNVVNRLKLLIGIVEGAGSGTFPRVDVSLGKWDNDEVGMLIREFNNMETELLHREAEISRKNNELLQSKKLAAIGTLAAGVAHELNNPLNNIYLSVQVLKRMAGENCPHPVKEIVEDITTQTARVKHIVSELLEFARGKEPTFADVGLRGLILKAWKSLGAIMNTESVIFSAGQQSDEIFIKADPAQLEQVFINLFHNAAEAMSGRGELKVGIEVHGKDVSIRVSDNGPGIPAEALERIFEPFFTTKDKGTGLGLAIVFNIISKHEGEIRAESGEGQGTTFIITLPKGKESHGL